MSRFTKHILYWTPRVVCILFALFLSLFAFDVFSERYGGGQALLAFLIHLVPALIVVVALLIAWRWEWIGALLFLGLAVWYVAMTGGQEHWSAYAVISGVCVVMGALFLLNWLFRGQLRGPRGQTPSDRSAS